jgi:hypothetical protein
MRHVHATTAAVEKQLSANICILDLVIWQADRTLCAMYLYCHLWPVWLNHICPHYLINGTRSVYYIFRENSLDIKCIFQISPQLLPQTFFILRKIQQDNIINVHRSSCKVAAMLVRF